MSVEFGKNGFFTEINIQNQDMFEMKIFFRFSHEFAWWLIRPYVYTCYKIIVVDVYSLYVYHNNSPFVHSNVL